IAYQIVGERGPDLIIVPGFISHLDLQWTDLGFSRFLERLASFTRLILYDKPGTGLSDPIPHVPTLEERIADIRVLLDAVGSKKAVLFARCSQRRGLTGRVRSSSTAPTRAGGPPKSGFWRLAAARRSTSESCP